MAGRLGNVTLFVACFAVILTMYGGGFATIPAYLSDLFGTRYVGAVHGRLLTAWSAAGVLGPVLVNYIREYEIERGVPNAQAYNHTLYLMAGLLLLGLVCNALVRPVAERHHMKPWESDLAATRERPAIPAADSPAPATPRAAGSVPLLAGAWAAVAAPLTWGVASTLSRALALFRR